MTATLPDTTSEPALEQQLAEANNDHDRLVGKVERARSEDARIWRKLLNLSQNYDPEDPAAQLARNGLLDAYGANRSQLAELREETDQAWARVTELRKALEPQPKNSRVAKAKTAYSRALEANESACSEFATAVAEREKIGARIARLEGRIYDLEGEVKQVFDQNPRSQSARKLAKPHWNEIVKIQSELAELRPLMKAAYVREEQTKAATRKASRIWHRAGKLYTRANRSTGRVARIRRSIANLEPSPTS